VLQLNAGLCICIQFSIAFDIVFSLNVVVLILPLHYNCFDAGDFSFYMLLGSYN